MTTTLSDDLLALRELKDESAKLTKDAKVKAAEYKVEQRRVMDRMEAEGADGHKAGGTTFSVVTGEGKEYGTIQDRKAFVEWALENDPELIEYKERGEQLNAFVRRLLDDGEELPPGVGWYDKPYISMTGGRSK